MTSIPKQALAVAGLAASAAAQQPADPTSKERTSMEARPQLTAALVDAEKNAARGTATVTVKVMGLNLTDPATVKEVPKPGQGHLHYQLDDGPVVATTTPKLSFHGLKPGEHRVVVMLAGNDHEPLGPQETLSVRVPQGSH
jgi:uncharacterized protein DUF6130